LIGADTSSLIAYLAGERGADVHQIGEAMAADELRLPPPTVTELLSKPSAQLDYLLHTVPLLDMTPGFWVRAGKTRGLLRAKGLKAALADSLIAQCCIDADVALIARDGDYRHFAKWCGLKLAE
jgi:predicted nucleic acid-binding protein